MKQYTIGKKAAVIVLHQLCMILMVTGVFATGYAFRHDAHENIDIYTLISLAGPGRQLCEPGIYGKRGRQKIRG